jgi:DNA (cytosine-5)-methyltransferase 1
MSLTLYDEFAGCGGSSQGAAMVPGVELVLAANHDPVAIDSHSANFPYAEHYLGDVRTIDLARFRRADLFWSSPICPPFSSARGKRRDFDRDTQGVLFETAHDAKLTAGAKRGRLLMHEVPRYLDAMTLRGEPVLAGVVENVVEARKWDAWGTWLNRIKSAGYETRVIAFNSMHAAPPTTARAPQSRDRLYVAYWLRSLGRVPDWDKWLRPRAWCPACDEMVSALQVFKNPRVSMGRYGRHGQYWYRCPHATCRNRIVDPQVLPASAAIDWTLKGTRIGDRVDARGRPDPLAPATLARIQAGIERYWEPVLAPAGGTWRTSAVPVSAPMPCRTTRETDGVAVPPFLVPLRSGRPRTIPVSDPLATVVANGSNHGLVTVPFITVHRGSGGDLRTVPVGGPVPTVTAAANHFGLAALPGMAAPGSGWDLLVPYYGNGHARPASGPVGTLPTRDKYALVSCAPGAGFSIEDVLFRMLEPHEIARAMAFAGDYIICGSSKRVRVRQLGNAVTPPVAEIIVSALVEVITGEDLECGELELAA